MMKHVQYSTTQWWIAIFAILLYLYGPGKLEGRLFPAAAPMVLTNVQPATMIDPLSGDRIQATIISLESARLRHPNCAPRKLEWFEGQRSGLGNNTPVPSSWGPPIVRGDGRFSATGWKIGVPVHRIEDTFSDVLHRCNVLGIEHPWLTRTRFWN